MINIDSKYPTIEFKLIDQYGCYTATSPVINEEVEGITELDHIGMQFNAFLQQCGYVRGKHMIFMQSIDEEEYDAIESFLQKFREDKNKVNK